MLVKRKTELWDKVRRLSDRRLAELAVRALYGEPFTVYLSCADGLYAPDTHKFCPDVFTYNGEFACIALGKEKEDFLIARLTATQSSDLYTIHELPRTFSRLPTRVMTVNVSSIVCILKPCSNK